MSLRSRTAHQARIVTQKTARKTAKPSGTYDHSEHQWGEVTAVNGIEPLGASVDLKLDGSPQVTSAVKHLDSYTPSEGDVVLVYRGKGRNRSSRVVLGKLYGSTTPTFTPYGGQDSEGRSVKGPNGMWGGSGVPDPNLGMVGDSYWRTDTPEVAGQRHYIKTTAGWTATTL